MYGLFAFCGRGILRFCFFLDNCKRLCDEGVFFFLVGGFFWVKKGC